MEDLEKIKSGQGFTMRRNEAARAAAGSQLGIGVTGILSNQ